MGVSGKPEKESSIRILDMQVKSSEIEDRSPLEIMRWQYWVTSGVILKASNEEYEDYAVMSAIQSTLLFCYYLEPHFRSRKKYFENVTTNLLEYIKKLTGTDKSLGAKSNYINYCSSILREVNYMMVDIGEVVSGKCIGEM